MIGAELCLLKVGRPIIPSIEGSSPETIESAAKKMNVGHASIERAKSVRKHAPELVEAVKAGNMTVGKASKIADAKRHTSKPAKKEKEPVFCQPPVDRVQRR